MGSGTKQNELRIEPPQKRLRVFVSYNRADKKWLEQLMTHLKPQIRDEGLDVFLGEQLEAGALWLDEIERALREARIAILLISKDFLASDFITEKELPPLLAAAQNNEVRILSLLVSPCTWPKNLSQYQAVNSPSQTLAEMTKSEVDRLMVKLVEQIRVMRQGPQVHASAPNAPDASASKPTTVAQFAMDWTPSLSGLHRSLLLGSGGLVVALGLLKLFITNSQPADEWKLAGEIVALPDDRSAQVRIGACLPYVLAPKTTWFHLNVNRECAQDFDELVISVDDYEDHRTRLASLRERISIRWDGRWRGSRIEGHVYHKDGKLAANGVDVSLDDCPGAVGHHAVTDALGKFTLAAIPSECRKRFKLLCTYAGRKVCEETPDQPYGIRLVTDLSGPDNGSASTTTSPMTRSYLLEFASTPTNALVYQLDPEPLGEPFLGLTPLRIKLPRQPPYTLKLKLARKGYQSRIVELPIPMTAPVVTGHTELLPR